MNIGRHHQIKILIVDNNPKDRDMYKRLLKQANGVEWTILESDTGKKGLDLCIKERPGCLLLDSILPDTGGLEFLLRLKNMSATLPVILLTSQGHETAAVSAMKKGASNYLVKSALTPASLKKAILNCVRKNSLMKGASGNLKIEPGPENSSLNWNKKKKVELISEIHTLTEKLQSSAGIDPLTGLPNRKNMLEKMHYEKPRFERNRRCFSLIMADIDDFKNIRDTFGPETGNDILIQVGRLLDLNSRAQDVVGHWGRERFLLLLPDTDLEGATVLIEKLCKKVELGKFPHPDRAIPISMSFRTGVYDDETLKIEDCVEQADECLL